MADLLKLAFRERMKALKISDLNIIVETLQALCGRDLQEIVVSKRDVALGFRSEHSITWVVIDLFSRSPSVWSMERIPFRLEKQKTPLELFLKSHFKGKTLERVFRDESLGRVIHFTFHPEGAAEMELRLIPHGQNIILKSGAKKLSLNKVQALEPMVDDNFFQVTIDSVTYESLYGQWVQSRSQKRGVDKSQAPSKEKILKKLTKALTQLEESQNQLKSSRWKQAGDFLVQTQDLKKALVTYPECLDAKHNLSENIENCFSKHKKNLVKIEGGDARLNELKVEILRIQNLTDQEFTAETNKGKFPKANSPNTKSTGKHQAKTRKLMVSDDLEFLVGKSAKDNLALLRRARSWDCWFHLQDFPSSHGILFKNKNRKLTDSEIFKAARFLVETYAEKNKNLGSGEMISVIWTESRFVRPIKGDKLGRVTHKNTQTVTVKL